MVEIVLTTEQAQIVADANRPVVLRDPDGKAVGILHALPPQSLWAQTDDEIVEEVLRRRAARKNGPVYTTQQVLDYLQSLDSQ
jgi:hypothetical protein